MLEVWALIKEQRTAVILVWDGEGPLPTYGHPSGDREKDLTTAKIARVMGCVTRPVRAADVMKHLEETGLLAIREVSVE
jgi:hypothetical protein